MSTVETVGLPEDRGIRPEHVHDLLEAGETEHLAELLSDLHPSDLADLLNELDDDDRVALLDLLPADIASETLAEMATEEHPAEL